MGSAKITTYLRIIVPLPTCSVNQLLYSYRSHAPYSTRLSDDFHLRQSEDIHIQTQGYLDQ